MVTMGKYVFRNTGVERGHTKRPALDEISIFSRSFDLVGHQGLEPWTP